MTEITHNNSIKSESIPDSHEIMITNDDTPKDNDGDKPKNEKGNYNNDLENKENKTNIIHEIIKIKKLIIRNFLSFKYEEIDLDPKFTIAFGPNGAGKSTIYQALKFALGSNNYDGRYNKWSDFIRDGQTKGFVEIYISINNNIFGIKRTVHIDKSPKFYFKKPDSNDFKLCQGKRIKKFIARTKINPDNIFSFMSQGSIDSLKDFNEITLCNFIERGIGMQGLRIRIIEQKNKIEELKREEHSLETRKNNYNYQLLDLKPKIRRLKEKKEIEKKKEELENELLWAQRDEILEKIENNRKIIIEKEDEIKQLKDNIEDRDKSLNDAIDKLKISRNQFNSIIEDISQKSARKEAIMEKMKTFSSEKIKISEKIQEIDAELKEKTSKVQLYTIEKDKVSDKKNLITNQLKKTEKIILQLRDEQTNILSQSEKHQEMILKYQSKKQEIEALIERLNDAKKEHKLIEDEIKTKIGQINKLRHDLKDYNWFMKNPSDDLEEQYFNAFKKSNARIKIYEEDLKEFQEKYNKILKQIEEVKKSVYDKDMPKPYSIQKMMQLIVDRGLSNECYGPLIDYISFNDLYHAAIKSIFGFRILFSFIAKNDEAFHRLKRIAQDSKAGVNIYLSRNSPIKRKPEIKEKGKGGIIEYLVNEIEILNDISDIKKVIHSVAGDTLLVKDGVIATNYIKLFNWQNWIVTLEGEQIRPKKLVIESRPYIQKKNEYNFTNITQTKQYLRSLEEQAEQNRSLYNKRKNAKEELVVRRNLLEKRLKEVGVLLSKFKKMEILTKSKNKNINKRKQYYDRISEIEEQIETSKLEMEKISENLPDDIQNFQERLKEIPGELKILENNKKEYLTSLDNTNEQLQELNNRLIQLKTEIQFKQEEFDALNNSLRDNDGTIAQLLDESMELTYLIEELEDKKKQIQDDILDDEKKLEDIRSGIEYLNIKINKIESEIQNFERYIKEKEEKLELIKLKIKEEKKQIDLVRSIPEIKDLIYKLSKDLSNYRDVDDSLLSKKKELKDMVRNIILKQEEIFEEIASAQDAENQLENSYYKKFKSSLQILEVAINKKFAEAEIGFNANIELRGSIEHLGCVVNTSFLLESGESSTRQLSALSGGQRSMVGICLMLSLNQLNPTPFNIYDEIEMFLDPQNAQTVAKLIYNLTQDGIQFVLLMPDKSKTLIQLANKVLGVCRNGKHGASMVLNCRTNNLCNKE